MPNPTKLSTQKASAGSAFQLTDPYTCMNEAGSEQGVFLRTIRVVRDDLNEVRRLSNINSVRNKLLNTPERNSWVQGAIYNTNTALNEIGMWVERARAEQQSPNSVQSNGHTQLILHDQYKLENRKTELTTCYQQLSNVLHYLMTLDDTSNRIESPMPEGIKSMNGNSLRFHNLKPNAASNSAVIASGRSLLNLCK